MSLSSQTLSAKLQERERAWKEKCSALCISFPSIHRSCRFRAFPICPNASDQITHQNFQSMPGAAVPAIAAANLSNQEFRASFSSETKPKSFEERGSLKGNHSILTTCTQQNKQILRTRQGLSWPGLHRLGRELAWLEGNGCPGCRNRK